ncbi:hypothetical protein ABEB36_008939 [Hypothenemus hampei]|uniref:Major facilitator superfamily (MFS) profile domain-containing protein n=1 Tax=Hypothenemus hampei TaxID=57062 RepID=A0ABD1ENJ0_HYPHA
MTRPVLLSENSRSALMTANGFISPNKLPQFIAAFISTIPAVCLGMVFSWTSSAIPILEKEISMTATQGAWVGSLVTLGAFVGAVPTGFLAQKIGRKKCLLLLIMPLFCSWILIGYFYHRLLVLYLARFFAGISCGCISVAAPLYVSEVAHISIRGTLGTFFQVQITVGFLLEYLLGDVIGDIKTLSLVSSILPVAFFVAFSFIPESPTYLCKKAETDEALKSLIWLRGNDYEVEDELVKITEEIKEGTQNKATLFDLISYKATYKGLIISFGLMVFQQLSGVNAVLFYTNTIFEQSGGSLSAGACSILVGLVQVVATLCSTMLIDKSGRKILLILSISVMSASLAILGTYFYLNGYIDVRPYSFLPLVSLALFIIFFSIGFGPIPWMIMGEIFPPHMKGTASSAAASLNWILAFIVTNQFANLIYILGIGMTFIIFSIICVFGTAFVIVFVPETKGRSIEEIVQLLSGSKGILLKNPNDINCDKATTTV